MNTENDSEAIFVLEMLVHQIGVLDLVRWLVEYEGGGGEGVCCEFDEEKPCLVVAENLGEEEFERLFYLPGRRIAPLLEDWVNEVVEKRRRLVSDVRSLAIEHLPRIFETFGCKARDFEAELDRCADELHALGMSAEDIFPSTASKDPVERTFYQVYLKDLTGLLPKLSQGEPWSIAVQEIVPRIQNGSVVEVELRTDIHPRHTETRIAPDVFCDRLFTHLCEVIAYYRVLADEAQQALDTTLPKLIEKMKNRGVW